MVDKNNTEALVQLAAVVYSDSDSEIRYTKNNIIRKIIQLSIFQTENKMQKIEEIADHIKNTYGLVFMEDEIWDIIKKNSDKFYIDYCGTSKDDENKNFYCVSLTSSEYIKISSRSNTMSLNKVISDFYNQNLDDSLSLENVTDLILNFIFVHFVSNIKNYSNCIERNANRYSSGFLSELKDTLPTQYDTTEINIINSFIDFEDDNKNRYIFYIITLALEYSLTLNLPSGAITNQFLIKTLYLDTNIILSALGADGLDRQSKTILLLDKCLQSQQLLTITSFTEIEFEKSLKLKCKDLDKYKTTSVKSYNYVANKDDIIELFLKTKQKTPHLNSEIFRSGIQADYNKLKEKYKIKIENINHSNNTHLESNVHSLYEYKYRDEGNSNYKETCKFDIYNLDYIARKTSPQDTYPHVLFITDDRKLSLWTKKDSIYSNITMMPSDWLSFLLRFGSRSDNEYKSFVNLLKITPLDETHFEPNQISTILNMVSSVDNDPDRQEIIIENMIKNNYDEIKNTSQVIDLIEFSTEIDPILSKEVKRLYESDIEKIREYSSELINEKVDEKDKVIESLKEESTLQNNELSNVKKELEILKEKDDLRGERKEIKKFLKNSYINLFLRSIFLFISAFIIYIIVKPLYLKSFYIKNDSIGSTITSGSIIALIAAIGTYTYKLIIPKTIEIIELYKKLQKIKI